MSESDESEYFIVCNRSDIWFTGIFQRIYTFPYKEQIGDEVVDKVVFSRGGIQDSFNNLIYSFDKKDIRFIKTLEEAHKVRERMKLFM